MSLPTATNKARDARPGPTDPNEVKVKIRFSCRANARCSCSLATSIRYIFDGLNSEVPWQSMTPLDLITMNLTVAGGGGSDLSQSYPDLTPDEQVVLLNIRKRKEELLQEIYQLKEELTDVNTEIEAMDTEEGAKMKNLQMGKKKFNMDPKKGIEFLISHDLIKETPEDVAAFLYKGEGLNKTMIGDYLGERADFNEAVLKAFVELHDFTDLILVQALRQFLWSFRLPGEAQKIDRMMESFAQRYCQLNPDIFTNSDTCYVLSFAVIMLNTSLHNPSVKDKPTVDQFISMNRGIDNGGDLPKELLVSLYDSIKTEPFKIPEDDGNDLMHTFFNPDREGMFLFL